jgi:hypothetical protein
MSAATNRQLSRKNRSWKREANIHHGVRRELEAALPSVPSKTCTAHKGGCSCSPA